MGWNKGTTSLFEWLRRARDGHKFELLAVKSRDENTAVTSFLSAAQFNA